MFTFYFSASNIQHRFFDDVAAMTLKYLDSLVQRDDVTKSQFFKNLSNVLDKLPLVYDYSCLVITVQKLISDVSEPIWSSEMQKME